MSPDRHSRLSTITELTERTEPSRHWPSRQQLVAMNNPRALSSTETTSSYGNVIGESVAKIPPRFYSLHLQSARNTSRTLTQMMVIRTNPVIQIGYPLPHLLQLFSVFQVMTPRHLFARRRSQRYSPSHQGLLPAFLVFQCQQRITSQTFRTSHPSPARNHLPFPQRTCCNVPNLPNAPSSWSWQVHAPVQYPVLDHQIWRQPLCSLIQLCVRLQNPGFR